MEEEKNYRASYLTGFAVKNNGKFSCLGVNISHNEILKYATTMKASWNVKFSGF
jgi:hypothetical protein